MSATEWIPLGASALSIVIAGGAIAQNRRKPALDASTLSKDAVTNESVKAEIKKMADETNLARDQRIWQLEQFVDKARPYFRVIHDIVDELCQRLKAEVEKNGGTMPDITVPDPPEIPPPVGAK